MSDSRDDKPDAAGLADEIALQDKSDFSNAEWGLIVSALRALAYPPSAELSFEEELRAIAKETGKPESVEFVEKLIAAGHTPSHVVASQIKEAIAEARREYSAGPHDSTAWALDLVEKRLTGGNEHG